MAKRPTQTGVYRALVVSHSGTGDYVVDVSGGLGQGADQRPQVSVDQPAAGATVSGIVPVKVRATDDRSVTRVEVALDGGVPIDITGSFDGNYYNWAWDSTLVPNGAHDITAGAVDSAGQQAQVIRTVTVSNSGAPPNPTPVLQQEVTRSGRVTAGARDANAEVTVHQAGFVDLTVTWSTRADLDFYVYAPNGTLIGRAYTLNNPERLRVDTTRWGTGVYRVRINLYGGADSDFTLTASGYKAENLQGAVSPGSREVSHTRQVGFRGRGRAVLRWAGTSDLDFFVYDPTGRERVRAYTLSNPEQADIPFDATGSWRVKVSLYSGASTNYDLQLIVPEAVLS